MTFLNPIPALIAGSIALPLLLVFFLLKLRRRPVRVPSTMLWEQAVRDLQANIPFRWLRPSWHLLLSLLILLLLLLALARPAIDAPGARARLVVLIIDQSASMRARDVTPSRLDEAKHRARRTLASLRRSGHAGRVAVIAAGADARTIQTFTRDLNACERAVSMIEGTDQEGNLASALELAEALIASSRPRDEDADAVGALCIIFSDAGVPPDTPLTIAGAEVRLDAVVPETPPENLGITAISARRDFNDPSLVRVFVRVQSAAPEDAGTITLTFNGQTVAHEPVVFRPDDAPGDAPPQQPIVLEFVSTDPGVLVARLEPDDALSADDRAQVVLDPPAAPAIVVVRDTTAVTPSWALLEAVLRELRPRSLTIVDASGSPDPQATDALVHADLVIFDGALPPTGLPPIDAPILALGVLPEDTGRRIDEPDSVRSWRRDHPVLRDVPLDALVIARVIRLPEDDRIEPLALGRSGPLIALDRRARHPRLLVAFRLEDSNWALHFGFPIFIANTVGTLVPDAFGAQGRALRTTDPVSVVARARHVELLDASGTVLRAREAQVGEQILMAPIPQAGIYEVRGADPSRIAVNLASPHESALVARDALHIAGREVRAAGEGDAAPTEIWHWFVLAAAALALVEWFVYALQMRA